MKLAFTATGSGDPLVLIMGLGAPGAAWEAHVNAWSTRFRCVLVDNRGSGASPAPPGPYTTADMADDYAELIEDLGTGPVRIAGISMGGAIAQQLALRHPELVSKLVLVATWARCDAHLAEILQVLPQVWDRPLIATALLQWLIWTPEWFEVHREELLAERVSPDRMPVDALSAQAAACVTHDTLDQLGRITVPTLVTAGSADRFVPAAVTSAVAERIPGARLNIFDGAGHAHHWERLARFNRLVEEWLI